MNAQPKHGELLAVSPAPAEVVTANATSIMEAIMKVAADPASDVDKFVRLVELHERLQAQQAVVAFNVAFSALQPKLPTITETGGIKNNAGVVQSTYAKWEDINDAIKPLLAAEGFSLSFRPGIAPDGKVTTTAVLRHNAGHQDEATVTLPHDSSGSKNSVQAVGSSLSYGKRYAAIAVLNITSRAKEDRDDDGRGAGLSDSAQRALTEINMADGLPELRQWKADKFDGLSKLLDAAEIREVIALYNRRLKSMKAAQAEGQSNG